MLSLLCLIMMPPTGLFEPVQAFESHFTPRTDGNDVSPAGADLASLRSLRSVAT
jgi:hypothetical protein